MNDNIIDQRNPDFVFCPTRKNAIAEAALRMKSARFDGGKEWISDPETLDYSITPVTPEKQQLNFSFERLGSEPNALVIRISGTYPQGSAGDEEGKMLRLMMNYEYYIVPHTALIVDMRQLEYKWGDGWEYAPYNVKLDKASPFRLIISNEQETHMRGLMGKENRISRRLKDACEALNIDCPGIRD